MVEQKANQMWGGAFDEEPHELMQVINASIDFDRELYAEDIAGSAAHCMMLVRQGIIPEADGELIINALVQIKIEIQNGEFQFRRDLEDIHMNIEARVAEIAGKEAAGKLHTARSRNDQVALDFKLWVRNSIDMMDQNLMALQKALLEKAEENIGVLMPGFTHLQIAQPVSFAHHLLAYVEMLGRDRGRLADCRERLNECPLGAAALAGTSFPIDRYFVSSELEFRQPTANSMDSVSDRDFAIEFLSCLSIISMHLSRFAEEIILWATPQFGFIRLSHKFTTGSSIMPQKRNPDAAELVRAKTGRVYGSLMSLLTIMKALPLTYSKDMQEDKEPVFDAERSVAMSVALITEMTLDMQPHKETMLRAASSGYSTATDLADWLVQNLGMPFRQAHHVTGQLVKMAETKGVKLEGLTLTDMKKIEPGINNEIYKSLSPANSAKSRSSHGGTSPERIMEAIAAAKEKYL